MPKTLIRDDPKGNDYTMQKNATSVWITISNISVYICQQEDGVRVELYPLDMEDNEKNILASAHASYEEAS